MMRAREIEELKQKICQEQESLEQFRMEYREALSFLARPGQTALYDREADQAEAQVREKDAERALSEAKQKLERANGLVRTSQTMLYKKKESLAQTQEEIDNIQRRLWQLR